jgi:hypothetical protein
MTDVIVFIVMTDHSESLVIFRALLVRRTGMDILHLLKGPISEDILAIAQPAIEERTFSSLQLGDGVADQATEGQWYRLG